MKNFIKSLSCVLMLLLVVGTAIAQTPTDAIMMKQRESCLGIIYDHGSWDHYWEGTYLRTNATVATVSKNTILPMIAIGVTDRLNVIVMTPYVSTKSSEPNGGKFQGAKGMQDIGISIKGELFNKQLGKGKLALLGTFGFSAPMTNYLSDYMPYSIGLGAKEWSYRGIAQYRLDNGFYARGTVSYLWRGQTKAERDYYYNNGSYYTAWMDVPNAMHYQAVVGKWIFNNSLKVEAAYTSLKSLSGDDVRKYNAAQPTNKKQFDQIGVSAQYYFPTIKGLGLLANYAQIINGRNLGKSTNLSAGITYQFKI